MTSFLRFFPSEDFATAEIFSRGTSDPSSELSAWISTFFGSGAFAFSCDAHKTSMNWAMVTLTCLLLCFLLSFSDLRLPPENCLANKSISSSQEQSDAP